MWRRIDGYKKKIKDNRIHLFLAAFFFVIVAVIFLNNSVDNTAQHVASLENGVYAFSPSGEKGGAIIPASCPSYEHVAGQCSAPAWISGSCPAPGTSATVSWQALPARITICYEWIIHLMDLPVRQELWTYATIMNWEHH